MMRATIENQRTRTTATTVLAMVLIGAMTRSAADEFTLDTARAAAAKGDGKALYFLGKRYAKGDGVPKDLPKAVECLRQAAEGGYAPAQNDLGAFYAKGWGG